MPTSVNGLHVLVVDDEYLLAKGICRALRAAQAIPVGPAANLSQALELAASSPRLDAAVLDVNLQGEMVYPLAERLRTRGIPFLFITGYSGDRIDERFEEVPCLQKPVDAEALWEALASCVSTGAAGAAAPRP